MKKEFFNIKNFAEFDEHSLFTYINDKNSQLRAFVAIYRVNNNKPAFGATRPWKDALRFPKIIQKNHVK